MGSSKGTAKGSSADGPSLAAKLAAKRKILLASERLAPQP